jgi:hypothetical protein
VAKAQCVISISAAIENGVFHAAAAAAGVSGGEESRKLMCQRNINQWRKKILIVYQQ